jgi:hypothetical protein
MGRRKQLHQSGLEMLSKCGEQFRFRYLEGLKRPPNAFLICGTATDKAVGTDLNNKIETGELAQEDVLCDLARDAVETYPDKEEIELDDDESGKSVQDIIGETKDKAVRLVKAHHGEIAPQIRPVATNKKFSINVDSFLRAKAKEFRAKALTVSDSLAKVLRTQARHLNVAAREGLDFVGEFDIVEQFIDEQDKVFIEGGEVFNPRQISVIRDTKTSKKSPNQEMADTSHQLSAYSVAHHVLYGAVPHAVKLDYLVDLKSGPKTMTLSSTRDGDDVQKYLNRMVNGVIQIQSGIFMPAPNAAWWCAEKWCAYHSQCDFVKHRVTSVPSKLVQIANADTGSAVE